MILPITAYGHPTLRRETEEIDENYPKLNELIENMFQTMYYSDGVGLAAPQVNLSIRLFVMDASPLGDELEEFKDPEMDETELLENIEEFVDYSMTFTFDKKIKAIELNNFTQKDANTLLFELNKENVLQPSSFKIKLH